MPNSAFILAMASSWAFQVIIGRSWRAQVRMERVWVIRSVGVRDGWVRYK